jgi:hypothetical protein
MTRNLNATKGTAAQLVDLFHYWYGNIGDMEKSSHYKELSALYPKIDQYWSAYKDNVSAAKTVFESRFLKLLHEIETGHDTKA